jgi:hypothetical protein
MNETVKLLRDGAIENIKRFCEKENEDFQEVYNYYVREADNYNLKLPIDFYRDLYNLTLEL